MTMPLSCVVDVPKRRSRCHEQERPLVAMILYAGPGLQAIAQRERNRCMVLADLRHTACREVQLKRIGV